MPGRLLQLTSHQLKPGVPLPFNVVDRSGKLLYARGQAVPADAPLDQLVRQGLYVSAHEIQAWQAVLAARSEARSPLALFEQWDEAIWQLQRLLEGIESEPGFADRLDSFADDLVALVQRDADIAIFQVMRQDPARLNLYGLTHALHTALACQLVAVRLGWPDDERRLTVKAALTMNIAITELQGRLAALGRMTENQRLLVQAHPERGMQILQQAGITDTRWLQAVAQHHERPDGSGYPRALKEPTGLAQTLRLVDVFIAKISPRAVRPALPIQDAARQMFSDSQGSPVAAALIKEFGLYPPGDVVRLATGELAVVVRRGPTATTPLAVAVADRHGLPLAHTQHRDTAVAGFAVTAAAQTQERVVADGVRAERLYGFGD